VQLGENKMEIFFKELTPIYEIVINDFNIKYFITMIISTSLSIFLALQFKKYYNKYMEYRYNLLKLIKLIYF
jgi:hypothetical protein